MNRRTLKGLVMAACFVAGSKGEVLTSRAMAGEGSQLNWTVETVAEREKALHLLGRDGFAVIHNPAEETLFLNRLEQAGIKVEWAQHLRTALWANFEQGMQVVCWRDLMSADKLQIDGTQQVAGARNTLRLDLRVLRGEADKNIPAWKACCAWIPRTARLEVPGPVPNEIWTADSMGRDVADGLQARLEVKQPAIRPGGDITLTMNLCNVRPADGGNAITVWDNRYSEGYRADFYLVVTPDGQSRILRRALQDEWRKNIPTPIEIPTGESWMLGGIAKGDVIIKSLKSLGLDTSQEGIYTVTGYYEAPGSRAQAGPSRGFWGGQIATPPVEIRVGEGEFKAPAPATIKSSPTRVTVESVTPKNRSKPTERGQP